VLPGSRQIEGRLWARLGEIGRRQRAQLNRRCRRRARTRGLRLGVCERGRSEERRRNERCDAACHREHESSVLQKWVRVLSGRAKDTIELVRMKVNGLRFSSPEPRALGLAALVALYLTYEQLLICSYFDGGPVSAASAAPARGLRLKRALLAESSVVALAETFKVLGDTTRVRMLDALSRAELCVCDLAALLGLSESAVSHQLRLLRGMRLVRPRRDGRLVYYALDDQHIVGLFAQGLEHVEERALRRAAQSRERRAPSPERRTLSPDRRAPSSESRAPKS
jgi:ArsR family transcriptional regulator